MRKAYWAHASYYLFGCQRLGAAQEKEATPKWRSPPSPHLSRVRKIKYAKKAAGMSLPKTLALRTREVCKTAPNEACRYRIIEHD